MVARAGAKLGDGSQHMPVIQLGDYLRFVLWAAENAEASGPYNLTIPTPTTNASSPTSWPASCTDHASSRHPRRCSRPSSGTSPISSSGDVWLLPQQAIDQGFEFLAPDVQTAIRFSLRD